jgi:hypothetical protein
MYAGSEVHESIGFRQGERGRFGQIADGDLAEGASGMPHERHGLYAAPVEPTDEPATDESGRSSNKDPHLKSSINLKAYLAQIIGRFV